MQVVSQVVRSARAVREKHTQRQKSLRREQEVRWDLNAGLCFLSQDTVVALQALSTFAAVGGSHQLDVTISVDADASTSVASFHIHRDNYLLQQSQQVAESDGGLTVCSYVSCAEARFSSSHVAAVVGAVDLFHSRGRRSGSVLLLSGHVTSVFAPECVPLCFRSTCRRS